jgi:hypothetical protein
LFDLFVESKQLALENAKQYPARSTATSAFFEAKESGQKKISRLLIGAGIHKIFQRSC